MTTTPEHLDVLVVGAGLSGIDAAVHLQTEAPGTTFALLEARATSGGTWDLFRYPGVRSDSDMHTLGFGFAPWSGDQAIASGASILDYLRETAAAHDVDRHIRYERKVTAASWSSEQACWTVTVQDVRDGASTTLTCGVLFLCSGYYSYDSGYTPTWPGARDFAGQLVHPQAWPPDLAVDGKRVVVIGSGATAVTLVPALVDAGAQVTMLQRSPSYVMSMPAGDPITPLVRRLLPPDKAARALRWWNLRTSSAVYALSRKRPKLMRSLLRRDVQKRLPEDFDLDRHFSPRYDPWDQRMCLAPGGDFFTALREGGAQVVTDTIERFTADGIQLASGDALPADVVVTATGLNLLPLGGIGLDVDGEPVVLSERVAYKGMMLAGVPNLAFALGYTNASWTLKVDLVCSYVARMVAGMRERGEAVVTPRLPDEPMATAPFIEMGSGYFERSRDSLPLQGDRAPWRLAQDYRKDAPLYRTSTRDPELEYAPAPAMAPA